MTGTEFRECRQKLGLSQAQLAEQLEVGQKTISRLENERGDVKRAYALALLYLCRHGEAVGVPR